VFSYLIINNCRLFSVSRGTKI